MSILKSALVALALIFGSVGFVTVTATPAAAALTPTQQLVADLALQRKAQLDAQMAPFQAIINSTTATATQKNAARAAIQQAQLRAFQMQQFATIVQFFPETLLNAFASSFQREVSANASLVPAAL